MSLTAMFDVFRYDDCTADDLSSARGVVKRETFDDAEQTVIVDGLDMTFSSEMEPRLSRRQSPIVSVSWPLSSFGAHRPPTSVLLDTCCRGNKRNNKNYCPSIITSKTVINSDNVK